MTTAPDATVLTRENVPVSARRAQTRERLMAAATTVFAARGVHGASVEEICEAAGFTRGAFYSNFADKDALVLALLEAGISAQYAAAERAVADLSAAPAHLGPEELVSLVLTRFDALSRSAEAGSPSPEGVLAQQELMLHAARVPALHGPYTDFADACRRRLTGLITDALAAAGLELVLPLEDAIGLLTAAHEHDRLWSLFPGDRRSATLHTLVLTITRAPDRQP